MTATEDTQNWQHWSVFSVFPNNTYKKKQFNFTLPHFLFN